MVGECGRCGRLRVAGRAPGRKSQVKEEDKQKRRVLPKKEREYPKGK